MNEQLTGALIALAIKIVVDILVRLSKRTENHIDDVIVSYLKHLSVFFMKKK